MYYLDGSLYKKCIIIYCAGAKGCLSGCSTSVRVTDPCSVSATDPFYVESVPWIHVLSILQIHVVSMP